MLGLKLIRVSQKGPSALASVRNAKTVKNTHHLTEQFMLCEQHGRYDFDENFVKITTYYVPLYKHQRKLPLPDPLFAFALILVR